MACAVLLRQEGYDPTLKRALQERKRKELKNPSEKAKPRYNHNYALQLFSLYGAYPTAISHTKEYVPFFQGYGARPVRPEPIRCFDAANRAAEMADAWRQTEDYASSKLSVRHFLKKVKNDHATDIIESTWGDLGKPFYINSPNRGAATNLPYDAFLELRCDLDMLGPRPQLFGEMPRGVLALQHQVLDTHELTVEAAMTGSRTILLRAMMTDPLCNNIEDAKACISALLEAERESLPSYWFTKRRKKR